MVGDIALVIPLWSNMAVVEMTGGTFCLHSVETWDGVLWLTGCNMHYDMYDACTLPSDTVTHCLVVQHVPVQVIGLFTSRL